MPNTSTHNNEHIHETLIRSKVRRAAESLNKENFTGHQRLGVEVAFENYSAYTEALNLRHTLRADFDRINLSAFSKWWENASPSLTHFAEALWTNNNYVATYPLFDRYLKLVGWPDLKEDLKFYAAYEGLKSYQMGESTFYGPHLFLNYHKSFADEFYVKWCRKTSPDVALAAMASWGRGFDRDAQKYIRRQEKLDLKIGTPYRENK